MGPHTPALQKFDLSDLILEGGQQREMDSAPTFELPFWVQQPQGAPLANHVGACAHAYVQNFYKCLPRVCPYGRPSTM